MVQGIFSNMRVCMRPYFLGPSADLHLAGEGDAESQDPTGKMYSIGRSV